MSDKPKKQPFVRPATPGELKEIERVLGKGAWMVADTVIHVPVKVIEVGGKIIKVIVKR